MKKLLYLIIVMALIIVALIIGYGFAPATLNNAATIEATIETTNETTTETKDSDSATASKPVIFDDVMLGLFSFQTDQSWQIQLPESPTNKPIRVPLTELKQAHNMHLAIGFYQDELESGSVAVDYSKITALNLGNPEQEMVFAAPFVVTNQGSGSFWYVGLFRLNNQTAHISHIDSLFLGDRIKLNTLTSTDNVDVTPQLQVSYLKHGVKQAMAESPTELVEQTIAVSLAGFGR